MDDLSSMPNVGWQPLPGSQEFALAYFHDVHHILFHGARGPGKTDAQLMAFKSRVGAGYGPFWRGVIFDREYKNLDDLVKKSLRWFPTFGDGARFLSSKSDYKWVWPTGEELLFRAVKKPADYWNFHGQEFPFIGWNELAKYPTSELYDMLMSCNRSSYTPDKDGWQGMGHNGGPPLDATPGMYDVETGLPYPIPLRVFSTTNPWGAGHTWVKERFIDPVPDGIVHRVVTNVFNPRTQSREDVEKRQVAIFGSYKENIYLSLDYIADLEKITDENLRKAWLFGDWNVVAGGALGDVWKPAVHVKPRFVIPKGWRIDRSFDWGSTHPSWIGWFAEANGEEAVFPDGTTFCPPRGSLILLHELYTTNRVGTNQGTKIGPRHLAERIIDIEIELMTAGWVEQQPYPGPADNQISSVNDTETDTIEKRMADVGVRWEKSDKSAGSRKIGLQLMRDMLQASIDDDGFPGLYVMEHNRAWLATAPKLPRDEDDPDDVDTTAEDHPYDGTRYRILKGRHRYAKRAKIKMTN